MINTNIFLYGFLSVLAVSIISLVAVFTISISQRKLQKALFVLISLAIGTLFGDAFIHLIPESYESIGKSAGLYVIGGIVLFFVLEKFLRWQHCHHINHEEGENRNIHPVGFMNLFADGIHNFIDGVLIGSSYMVSIPIGLATTLAVILHEIPQEIGDFGILIHAGFTRAKALLLNLLSATVAILGFLFAIALGSNVEHFASFIIPIAAGGFIYIAGSDLVPELQKKTKGWQSFVQFLAIILGILIMLMLPF